MAKTRACLSCAACEGCLRAQAAKVVGTPHPVGPGPRGTGWLVQLIEHWQNTHSAVQALANQLAIQSNHLPDATARTLADTIWETVESTMAPFVKSSMDARILEALQLSGVSLRSAVPIPPTSAALMPADVQARTLESVEQALEHLAAEQQRSKKTARLALSAKDRGQIVRLLGQSIAQTFGKPTPTKIMADHLEAMGAALNAQTTPQ